MRKSRPILRLLIPAVLVTFGLALYVVGARSQMSGPKTVTVTITPANPPTVSPDPVTISKSEGDQVDWVCPNCTSGFKVNFPKGSPFVGSMFGPQNAKSGAARANAAVGDYHYAVTANGHTADPGLHLTN
jgi:hypothetical protein